MAKDPFEDLSTDFKDAVAGMNGAEIRDRITEVAKAQQELSDAKDNDQDLAEKKEAFKEASEPYREGSKMNRLKTRFCLRVLSDKGL